MITSSRLIVRHPNAADYSEFCRLEGDPAVKQFTGGPTSVSTEAYQRFVSTPSVSCMAVCLKHDDRFIGRCGFRQIDDRIELEIFLLPEAQGDGLGGELFDAMILHCGSAFPNLKVAGSVSPVNSRAVKLLASRGFVATGETVMLKSGLQHAVYIKDR